MIKLNYLLIFLACFCGSDSFAIDPIKDNKLDSLAIKLFELFKERNYTIIVDEYFLNKAECEKFDKLLLPNRRNAKINYTRDSLVVVFTNGLKNTVDIALDHDANLDQLKLISVKTSYSDKKLFNEVYKEKLLIFEIYCSDQKRNYFLTISPLVKSDGKWKVYLTEFQLREELKEK